MITEATRYIVTEEIKIENDDTGIIYEELFCQYLAGAKEVKVLEPYIRQNYQFDNLKRFVVLLKETQNITKVHLITSIANYRDGVDAEERQKESLDLLKQHFLRTGIDFTYEFDNHNHHRRITSDTGKTIQSDRGLHIYKPIINSGERANYNNRKCLQTIVCYSEPVDYAEAISTSEAIKFKQKEAEEPIHLRSMEYMHAEESFNSYKAKSNQITIGNITSSDTSKYSLSIMGENKHLFPKEERGRRKVFLLTVNYKGNQYDAKYEIGTYDGSISDGLLRFDTGLFEEIGIKTGANLTIRLENDGTYTLV